MLEHYSIEQMQAMDSDNANGAEKTRYAKTALEEGVACRKMLRAGKL